MKNTLLVILALVMALAMVMGPVSSVSAARSASGSIEISKVDVSTQTVYFTAKWAGYPDTSYSYLNFTPSQYKIQFLKTTNGITSGPLNPNDEQFPLTSPAGEYSLKKGSIVCNGSGYTFESGDDVSGILMLTDVNGHISFFYSKNYGVK